MTRRNALRTATRAINNSRSIKLATEGSGYATTSTIMVSEGKIIKSKIDAIKLNFTSSNTGYDAKSLSLINSMTSTQTPLTLETKIIRKNEIGEIHSKALADIKESDILLAIIDNSLNQVIDWNNLMQEQLDNWTGNQTDFNDLKRYKETVQSNRDILITERNNINALIVSIKDIFNNNIDVRYINAQVNVGQSEAAGTNFNLISDGTYLTSWDGNAGDLKADWKNVNHIVDSKLFNFSKNNFLDSSEIIKRKKLISKMNTLNSRDNNYSNRNFVMMNGVIKKINSHSELVNMKLASNLLNKDCRNVSYLADNLKDSIITQEDLSANIRLDGGGNGVEGFQTNFTIDGKRSAIGLLAKPSKRNKIKKSLLFSLKDKIRKLQKDKCEEPNKMNNIQISEPHENIHPKEIHNHYFSIAGKAYGQYNHRHNTHPHGDKGVPKHFFQHFAFRYAKNPRNVNNL